MKPTSLPTSTSQKGIIHLGIILIVVLVGAGLVVFGPKLYTDFVGAKVDIKQAQCKGCNGQHELKWNNKSRTCKKAKTATCIKAQQKNKASNSPACKTSKDCKKGEVCMIPENGLGLRCIKSKFPTCTDIKIESYGNCDIKPVSGATTCVMPTTGRVLNCCLSGAPVSGKCTVKKELSQCGEGLYCSEDKPEGATECQDAGGPWFCCPSGQRIINGRCENRLLRCTELSGYSSCSKTGIDGSEPCTYGPDNKETQYCCPPDRVIRNGSCVIIP